MQPFIFHCPTRIAYAAGAAASAAEVVKELGGQKTLLITDANLVANGILETVLSSFEPAGLPAPIVFDQVPADSDVSCVNDAVAAGKNGSCDSILAVGGGSVMDTAKVANICLSYGGSILDYQGLNNLPSRLLPLVAVPTTAGTGSEVSLVAMIRDSQERKKLLFGSRYLAPDAALLDPDLIETLPPKLTAATGLDALTHGLESLVAIASASPVSDALCIESMQLMFAHLERATKHGGDPEARAGTLVGSTLAGMAFTNTGVGIVHALAHAVGARFGTHHGMTNAVFLPFGMEFNLPAASGRYAWAARLLGISKAKDDVRAARELIAEVVSLVDRCGLPKRLRDLGVAEIAEEELVDLVDLAATDPAIMFNPREASADDLLDIYKRAY
jgi:alcohol dehydrogenase class IV